MTGLAAHPLRSLTRLQPTDFETPAVLKKTATAGRQLAELKGLASSMPNQAILINTLGLQEAKDSSAIENIVTTHDELFRGATYPDLFASPAAKEVRHYVQALRVGYDLVQQTGLLTANHMLAIQAELEQYAAGFRKLPGTTLPAPSGAVVYTPPQDPAQIVDLMRDLERFINDDNAFEADPLIKMAVVHHQFESIHPFLRPQWPHRPHRQLDYKHRIRTGFKFYSQDLINNLFMHPYTKIEFVERDLKVSRLTATRYLDALASAGFVQKVKVGRSNYYINLALNAILTRTEPDAGLRE